MNALSARPLPVSGSVTNYTPSDADECYWLVFTTAGTLTLPPYGSNGQFLAGYNIGVISLTGVVTINLLPNRAGKTPKLNGGSGPLTLLAGQSTWLRVGTDGNWYFLSGSSGTGAGVTGPGASSIGDIATFSVTTGNAIADSGISISSVATATNALALSNKTMNCANNSCLNWPLGSVTGVLGSGFGGTGLSSGTSGGILGFTGPTTIASSVALTANNPIVGGGAGALPASGSRSGTTTVFVTTTGTLTNGDCVKIDFNGNFVDNGSSCGGGGGGGTVTSGTAGQITYYPASAASVSGNANVTIAAGALSLGQSASTIGQLILFGNTGGSATITPQATAGSPTLTLPNTTGTFAVNATSPLALNATTGSLTCATCATTSNGGALSASTPIVLSAAGAISITGVAGQVLAGAGPAFTASPTLGVNASTSGQLLLANGNASGASVTLQNLGATVAYNFNFPTGAGTSGQPLLSGGGAAANMTFGTLSVGGGGSGATTFAAHNLLLGEAASPFGVVSCAVGTTLNGATAADPTCTATPTLGAAGGALGTLSLSGNTSGVITIAPQAAAGTYNFNLPITAGLTNQPLISKQGGANAMGWGTLSGNTSQFATVTGALVSGNCLVSDVNGNVKDSGAVCGGTTTFTLSAGFTNAPGTQNSLGSQTITQGQTLSGQLWIVNKSANYTLNSDHGGVTDSGNFIVVTGAGVTILAPNPGAPTKGVSYIVGSDGSHGFTLTTPGGTALVYGCTGPGSGATSATFGANVDVQITDDGTGYKCSELGAGGGSGITSITLTAPSSIFSVTGSPLLANGTLGITVAGTSGGIPYFSSASALGTSAALTANAPVIGGGAGTAPAVGSRSGNTTVFGTTSGALTSQNCIKSDASGNLVDAGAQCGRMVFIQTLTANNTATNLSFTGLPTTYNTLFLTCDGILATTAGAFLTVGEGAGPTWETGAHYNSSALGIRTGDAAVEFFTSAVATDLTQELNVSATIPTSVKAWVSDVSSTTIVKMVVFKVAMTDSNGFLWVYDGSGYWNSDTNAVTGLRLITADAANLAAGTCSLYGFN